MTGEVQIMPYRETHNQAWWNKRASRHSFTRSDNEQVGHSFDPREPDSDRKRIPWARSEAVSDDVESQEQSEPIIVVKIISVFIVQPFRVWANM